MLNILVVDDEVNMLNAIKRAIRGKYNPTTAKSVKEAVNLLEIKSYDIVITDLKMPLENGIKLIEHIRKEDKETGILVITGQTDIDSYIKILSLGIFEYLHKPFENEVLLTILDKMSARLNS